MALASRDSSSEAIAPRPQTTLNLYSWHSCVALLLMPFVNHGLLPRERENNGSRGRPEGAEAEGVGAEVLILRESVKRSQVRSLYVLKLPVRSKYYFRKLQYDISYLSFKFLKKAIYSIFEEITRPVLSITKSTRPLGCPTLFNFTLSEPFLRESVL